MRKKYQNTQSLRIKLVTNLVLSVLVLCIGVLCLSPSSGFIEADGKGEGLYRSAGDKGVGVSLMFNVYMGTEEVYDILDILEKYEAKATFFIGGCWADDNVPCLKAIDEAQHEIGNHGYFHKDHTKLNLLENQKEISSCNRFIELALGKKITLFAPPSGAYNNDTLSACKALNMKVILWSKDTIDWRDQNSSLIYERATKKVKNGDFILMHPTKATVEALGKILQYYQDNRFQTVTISKNLQNEGAL